MKIVLDNSTSEEVMNPFPYTKSQRGLPQDMEISRGETQKNVNHSVLTYLVNKLGRNQMIKALDLPCGNMQFLKYIRTLFPNTELWGADLNIPEKPEEMNFVQMDLTKEFDLPSEEQFDLITSISGIMVFGNTKNFIDNCIRRLKKGGVFVITNDNSATIIDRIAYLFLARYRIFKPIYEDHEALTQVVSIQEVCRLLRTHGLDIKAIKYTSSYLKDLKYLPFALMVYPIQLIYLSRLKTSLPEGLKWQMYPFKHLFCKHYIIFAQKINSEE